MNSARVQVAVFLLMKSKVLKITCLNKLITGTDPSVFSISRVHSLEVLAPRGNRFRSRVIEPRKSSWIKKRIIYNLIPKCWRDPCISTAQN